MEEFRASKFPGVTMKSQIDYHRTSEQRTTFCLTSHLEGYLICKGLSKAVMGIRRASLSRQRLETLPVWLLSRICTVDAITIPVELCEAHKDTQFKLG
jgi:hypothetical protein